MRVVNGQREHPVEVLQAIRAPGLVGFEDYFGIGVRAKLGPVRRELPAELKVVVDFAVENDAVAAGVVGQRLIGGFAQIDNGQPGVTEGDAADRARPACGRGLDGRAARAPGESGAGTPP